METPTWVEDIKYNVSKFTSKLKLGTILSPLSNSGGFFRKTAAGVGVILLVTYPAAFIWQYEINDDPYIEVSQEYVVDGGSHVVSAVNSLLDREVNNTVWAPNKPFFFPISWGDDMSFYQEGIAYAISRWAVEMNDYLGRGRSSTASDSDLETASGALKYNPRTWVYDISDGLLPRTSSAGMYNNAIDALHRYNQRLAAGKAVYDLRADNLINVLDRIRKDLGGQGASIELTVLNPDSLTQDEINSLTPEMLERLGHNDGHWDFEADDIFYTTKGRMYGYYVILRALGEDARPILEERNAVELWNRMLTSLRTGAELYSISISNGDLDDWVSPNHLTTIGFMLERSTRQMKELESVLAR